MIHVENLRKIFRRVPVLDGLAFTIERSEHVALVGANGSGKTTLIRCLLGEYGYEGTIRLDGISPRAQRTEILKRVGFVPQLPPPLRMPVKQLFRFTAQVCQSDLERMLQLGEDLGLELGRVLQQPFVKLSGGQRQKVLIALAMGRDTRVLLLDEPAANLDTDARRVFFELLAKRALHTTLLISSHRLDEVAPLVQRVIELDCGRIVLDDRVADSGAVDSFLHCHLTLRRREDAIARALAAWGFSDCGGGLRFEGRVTGPDRLRFFGMLSRYSGLITVVDVKERGPQT